jgi:hypothetical protein
MMTALFLLALVLAAYCWHLTRVLERDFGAPSNQCHNRDDLDNP